MGKIFGSKKSFITLFNDQSCLKFLTVENILPKDYSTWVIYTSLLPFFSWSPMSMKVQRKYHFSVILQNCIFGLCIICLE